MAVAPMAAVRARLVARRARRSTRRPAAEAPETTPEPRALPAYVPEQELDFPYLRRFGPAPRELLARLASRSVSHLDPERLLLIPGENAWNEADCLADYFTEFARVRSRVLGRETVLETWLRAGGALTPTGVDPPASWGELSPARRRLWDLREAVYALAAGGQCTNFRPSFVKCFLDWCAAWRFNGRVGELRVLDPCAGWGDRLVGALATGVAAYTAVDPNPMVHLGFRDMLEGGEVLDGPRTAVDLHETPFERFDARGRRFDVILTSPPFGPRERYWAPGSRSQAEQLRGPPGADGDAWARWWYDAWLLPALSRMVALLEPRGLLALYVADCQCLLGFCDVVRRHLESEGLAQLAVLQCGRLHRKPLWVYGR